MTRRALVITIAACALFVAGTASAVATGTVAISVGDKVKLNGTRVVCSTGKTSKGHPSIECGLTAGTVFKAGAYSAWVNDIAVVVYRNLGRGKYEEAGRFLNK